MALTAAGSPLVAGGDGQRGDSMALQKSYHTALSGFYANVYDSLEETDNRHQFRRVAPGEVVIMTRWEGGPIVASNKAMQGGEPPQMVKPEQQAIAADPPPPQPPEPTVESEAPAEKEKPPAHAAHTQRRGKSDAQQ